jgi:outer membrane protein assembly factor BamA
MAALFATCFYACSSTKSVPEGDRLYTGATVKWDGKKPRDYGTLSGNLASNIRPKPNKKVLGMPIRLYLYNMAKKPTGKGLNHLLRDKWGEAPVLLSSVKQDYTANVLEQYMVDNGFFQALVTSEIKNSGSKKASAVYTVSPNHRYRVKSVTYEVDSTDDLGKAIAEAKVGSSLRLNRPYRLDSVKAERIRITNQLKNKGYYYFVPDHLLVEVDSTNDGMVDLYVKIKDETPIQARRAYRMKNITLYPDYTLDMDTIARRARPVVYKDIRIVDSLKKFKPSVFDRSIFLKPDSLYKVRNHDITLRRLTDLGTFKFVKGQFRPVRGDSSKLNASFYLTPYPRRSLSAELRGTSKSNNFAGSEIRIAAKNRNWLHYANLLEISLSGGLEWQVGGKGVNNNLLGGNGYNLKAEAAVTIPRFYQPFWNLNVKTPYVPRTRISVSYELFSRSQLYNLNAYNFQFQYIWRKTQFLEHKWAPVSLTYVLPTKTTSGYDSILAVDPSQRAAIEKQFILGGNYDITYDNKASNKVHTFYMNGNLDYSGNLAGLIVPRNDTGKKVIIGSTFAQYIRLSGDIRHYWRLNKGLTWVNRIFAGYGMPYGNSTTLPFVKQFFIGGSASLRGFRARTLGPGSYRDNNSKYLANEAGDVKFEYNSELRAHLTGIFNAALFVDAGNIWLKKEIPEKPGSQFNTGRLISQLAVDGGIGLRVDASILVVRLDLATPFRKPWLPAGEEWVLKDIKFGDPDWRKENLILNIAIGYPF